MTHETPDGSQAPQSLDKKKELFSKAVSEYFSTLAFVDVNLRRQIYALEEANLIPPVPPSKDPAARAANRQASDSAFRSMGDLDVGELNSRRNQVGSAMEADVWAKAQELVESLETPHDGSMRMET